MEEKMSSQLENFIENIKNDRKIISFDEASTKQAIVLRILSLLEWDIFNIDEVVPEFSVAGKRVDYSLRVNNVNKIFIEVKKPSEDLENFHNQEQLLGYSFQEGVKLAILTNGITWWFYLPLHEGSWEQRKFYTIDILQQETSDIASKFNDFLSKENMASGKAVENAEAVYKGQQKNKILRETLPKAWNKIIEEADEILIDLINDTTEKICGYKSDSEMIEQFLSRHRRQLMVSEGVESSRISETTGVSPSGLQGNYTDKSPTAFYFKDIKYEIRSWKELLMKLCELINESHKHEFEKILNLSGRKRPYFSRNKDELLEPREINKTDIFAETCLSANAIVKRCQDVISLFGYSHNDIKIEVR